MKDDDQRAAQEIARHVAAWRPRVNGPRGVMAYLEAPPSADKRTDVNKTFLASTIQGVNSHNRRQEEEKCWTLRHRERNWEVVRDRRGAGRHSRSRSRSTSRRTTGDTKRRVCASSTSRNTRRREERPVSRRSPRRERRAVKEFHEKKRETEDERSYWARKKAQKASKIWENLHSEGTVSVENAPDFSGKESDDEDVKPVERNKI